MYIHEVLSLENDGSSIQGYVPTVTALLGLTYDHASAFCVAFPPLFGPPHSVAPLEYMFTCDCTYMVTNCCTAACGMVGL